MIWFKVIFIEHKYGILNKTSSLEGLEIFINEDIDIPEDQAKLWKEVQKVREVRNEGKWALIINRKDVIWDRNQKYNNK